MLMHDTLCHYVRLKVTEASEEKSLPRITDNVSTCVLLMSVHFYIGLIITSMYKDVLFWTARTLFFLEYSTGAFCSCVLFFMK